MGSLFVFSRARRPRAYAAQILIITYFQQFVKRKFENKK